MDHLTDPRISLRQAKHPKMVTEAVLATIELKTYLPMNYDPHNVTTVAAAQLMEWNHQLVTSEQQLTVEIEALTSRI